jgi:hypothetical protein
VISALVLSLGLAAASLQGPVMGTVAGTVRGEVRSEATGAPLVGALVEVVGEGLSRASVTDSTGGYILRAVPPGRTLLRARRLDHEPFEVEVRVPSSGEVVLDFALRSKPLQLSGIQVRGQVNGAAPAGAGQDTLPPVAPAMEIAGLKALESTPGIAEMGFAERPRGSPGQQPADPSDVLFVRGGSADLKLVLLDGAPVYTPFHLGGLLDPFEPGVLHSASLYLGGAPARYDGGLSYILDMSTRSGRAGRLRSSGAVDLMSTRAVAEGPLTERGNYLLSGRAIHWLGIAPFVAGPLPSAYVDGLMRLDVRVGGEGAISFTGFRNQESVRLDADQGISAGWGNSAVSLRYHGRVAGNDAEIGVARSGFDADLPFAGNRSVTEGSTERLRVTGDVARHLGPVRLRYGASFDRTSFAFHMRPTSASTRSWFRDGAAAGDASGAYLDAGWQPISRVRVRGGLRGELFSADPVLRFSPRVGVTWLLSDRAALSAAAGRYHQYVRTPFSEVVIPGTPPDTIFFAPTLAVGDASHFTIGLHQELDAGVRLGVEGFFKTFGGVPAPAASEARASGMDLWVRRETGSIQGWLGYSLSWVWSLPSTGGTTDRFDGRQLVNAGASGAVGRWGDLDLRVAYGAGLPFTAIGLDLAEAARPTLGTQRATTFSATDTPPLPDAPADPYLRLDLGISRTFNPTWGRVPVEITPYLKMMNALNRRDAIFYRYDRSDDSAPHPLAALPVLPLLGVQWKF